MIVAALCWSLVYLARALTFARLAWGTAVLDGPLTRWTSVPLEAGGFRARVFTGLGVVLLAPVSWISPAAVWLVRVANRGLPPLGPDDGFLKRLYPRVRDW